VNNNIIHIYKNLPCFYGKNMKLICGMNPLEINPWSALSRWPPEQIKAEYNG
jgi:hypothetical protein